MRGFIDFEGITPVAFVLFAIYLAIRLVTKYTQRIKCTQCGKSKLQEINAETKGMTKDNSIAPAYLGIGEHKPKIITKVTYQCLACNTFNEVVEER